MSEPEVQEEGPLTKRLRIGDPDIKIVVRCTKDGKELQKEYSYYSYIIAGLSNFFDAALSAEMKEKSTGEIVLEDLDPELFEKAMRFQQDMKAARAMKPEEATEIAPFYNQYEFVGGLELCDAVLYDYFQKFIDVFEVPKDLDFFVNAVVVSGQHNLQKAAWNGTEFIAQDLSDDEYPFGVVPFSEEQLKRLLPLFQEMKVNMPAGFSLDDIDNPLFMKYYVQCRSTHYLKRAIAEGVKLIDAGNCFCMKIKFYPNGKGGFLAKNYWDLDGDGRKLDLLIEKIPEEEREAHSWRIECHELVDETVLATVLWVCPHGRDLDYPPCGPWDPVHPSCNAKSPMLW